MELTDQQREFLFKFRDKLNKREFLIKTFNHVKDRIEITFPTSELTTISKRFNDNLSVITHRVSNEQDKYHPGDIVTYTNKIKIYVGVYEVTTITDIKDSPYIKELSTKEIELLNLYDKIDVIVLKQFKPYDTSAPMHLTDTFMVSKTGIQNFNRTKPELTSVGRYLLNQCLLVEPFGMTIDYVNEVWDQSKVEQLVAQHITSGNITVPQFKHFINITYMLGHFTELIVPTLTKKALTTNPKIKIRKQELFKQYEGHLEEPEVIRLIENELIAMDKAWLKGDSSVGFYDGVGSKAYNIHRKKLFLTVGGIDEFADTSGKYNFIKNSLNEGWSKEDFPTICNEIRKGSYGRGKETAKGGELTAYLARVFQNLKVNNADCKTDKGLLVTPNKNNIKEFYGRTVIDKPNIIIDENNASTYIDKTITIRSPMYCKSEGGYCYTCVGEIFKKLDFKALGMLPATIGNVLLSYSMASMHGTKLTSVSIDPNKYFIQP